MRPFEVHLPDDKLGFILGRVREFRWDAMPDAGSWSSGMSMECMRDIARYWAEEFDWREAERGLNRYPQFISTVDGLDIHFYHVRSPRSDATPLLLLHGWPGSVFEFLDVIKDLTNPASTGDNDEAAFHVVIPSLPGYGFSGRPARPIGPARVADLMAMLMTDILGYDRYIAQGGDWGAIVSTLIGHRDRKHCVGIHINMVLPDFAHEPNGENELAWTDAFRARQNIEGAYGAIQSTKPQSLGFAMIDSPVGIAAWIIEKFALWSDLRRDSTGAPDLLSRYSYSQLLTNVMIYLAQDQFVTSTWLYRGFAESFAGLPFAKGERCPTPTGVAAFPDPVFPPQPRSMAERNYNIAHWTDMTTGGHFAALEEPQLLVRDIRDFARKLVDHVNNPSTRDQQ